MASSVVTDGDADSVVGISGESDLDSAVSLVRIVHGDGDSVSADMESVLGSLQEGILPFQWVFPVFEWDDGAPFSDVEEDDTLQDQELNGLLPPAVPDAEVEVGLVLEQALMASTRYSPPATPSAAAQLLGRASPRPVALASPQRIPSRNWWRAASGAVPGASPRTYVSVASAQPSSTARILTPAPSTVGPVGTVGLSSDAVSSTASPWLRRDGSASDVIVVDEAEDDLEGTTRTSSVYALNDSGGNTVFSDTLQLDFEQLAALGRAPTRQRLSDDEARALPRVRFDAPELQSCSICLETFRHGMLLTGLSCGHVFHVDCLAQWVQRAAASCPNCRCPVQPFARPSQTR